MKKTFNDINVGDTLYQVNCNVFSVTIVADITKKGKQTMLMKTHGDFQRRIDVNFSKYFYEDCFALFIYKEDAIAYIKEKIEKTELKFKSDMQKLTTMLEKANEVEE